jgi:serine/threonine-protein kinase
VPQTYQHALGVVFFELVTGRRPYTADTPAAVLLKQANDPLPRPKEFVSDLPDEVEQFIFKVLAKDPAERYEDMGAFAAALESLNELKMADEVSTLTSPPAPLRGTERGEEPHPPSPLPYLGEESMTVDTPSPRSRDGAGWVLVGVVVVSVLLVVGGLLNNAFKPLQPKPTAVIAQGAETATAIRVSSTQVSPKDGMEMVYVPAGDFLMGSEDGGSNEKPQHTVTLDAYWIDQTEVTNALYARRMESGTCRATSSGRTTIADYENYPVGVGNWDQAQAYCGWAGERLPSEAEWEKAARGTDGRSYPWGEEISCGQTNYGGCKGEVQPVGSYPDFAGPYGALDMSGNLWEWMADVYPGTTDYMLKGGDWRTLAWGVRPAVRGGDWVTQGKFLWGSSWDNRNYCYLNWFNWNCDVRNYQSILDIGFRCVLSP